MSGTRPHPEIARLAHDIANSLARAISRLSILVEQDPDSEHGRGIREALGAVAEAREGLREILERSRGEARARLSLGDAWREASVSLGEAGIRTSLDAAAPSDAWADPEQIGEILASIVGTERAAGGSGREVRAEIRHQGARVVLDVRSAAPPFSDTELEQLHDPFFLKKPDGLGEGLGFALCNRIAAKNGGAFAVDDEGGGRRYLLELPAAASRSVAPPPSPARSSAPDALAGRCLLVDDDPRVRESCALMLRHLGVELESVGSGEEALERLAGASFDVVLLDLNLGPPVDGGEVLEELRRTRPEMLARTILATGDPTHESVVRFGEELGIAVLPKPFGVEDLRAGLAPLLRK